MNVELFTGGATIVLTNIVDMAVIKSYRDLNTYQRSRQLSREIFELTKHFPREETYSLTDQIRRSSRSIGAQLAEAWGKRRYEKSFISKLCDADGELQETKHWIETAFDCSYLSSPVAENLVNRYNELGKMLHGMIEQSAVFCPGSDL